MSLLALGKSLQCKACPVPGHAVACPYFYVEMVYICLYKFQEMEIDINQKKISIGDKYKIFIDGKQKYHAANKLFRFMAEMELIETESLVSKIKIKRRFAWLKIAYDFTRTDDIIREFRTISFWKRHYQCVDGNKFYDIYGHKGRKYSIYRNDKQIAFWDKKAVSWFNGDNYKIIADQDADAEILIAFCLIIDNSRSNHKGNDAMKWDIGYFGPQAKVFDTEWRESR